MSSTGQAPNAKRVLEDDVDAQGVQVTVSPGGSSTCRAVLVVALTMRRAQGLQFARDIVFVDSTASCDATKSTITVVLVATEASAVPLAVLVHRE
ncbi:hypothetical protein HPB50_008203 [Hyalomma asiaticum]|uniref:Uncharacterized protein n=1 Tax=Hyalomma asiaticum TaxID=266040 RepID=A0ACB7SFB8_HYAAI|nr:hypothetical protein HPB50_008203 [Hyalomma asiaticum]